MTDVSQSQEPDVLRDVSELEVDKLTLEVDDLRSGRGGRIAGRESSGSVAAGAATRP